MAFATGLPAFALTKVFQPAFYAREDTATPMRFAIYSVIVNIVASLVLSQFFGHVGIAIGTSLAAWTNAIQLYLRLRNRGLFRFDDSARRRLPLMLLSAIVMAEILLGLYLAMPHVFVGKSSTLVSILGLTVLVTAGIVSYFLTCHLNGALRFSELRASLRR